MDNELENPDYGIDTEVRLRYLQEQILSNKKRAVVEYYRIYLTTLSDFKEILQKEIEQLPEFFTKINWNSFIRKLPSDFLRNNRDFIYLATGFSDFSFEVKTLNEDDLNSFKQEMENAMDQDDNNEIWAKLSELILENLSLIQTQKAALKKDRRI